MAKKTPPKKSPKAEKAPRGAKTQWIKDYLAGNPDAKLREVSDAAVAAGLGKVQHVQFVAGGGKVKKRGGWVSGGKKGKGSNSAVFLAAQLLKATGSIKEAQAVLNQVAEIVEALKGERVPF